MVSRDANFLESTFGITERNADDTKLVQEVIVLDNLFPKETMFEDHDSEDVADNEQAEIEQEDPEPQEPVIPRRSQRQTSVPERLGSITGNWWNYENLYSAVEEVKDEPKNLEEASKSPNAIKKETFQEMRKNIGVELTK